MKITSANILSQLENALQEFGTYSFDDKGPDEVMDIDLITNELKKLPAEKAAKIIKEVIESSNSRGERLGSFIVRCMDDMPDTWFEVLLKESGANY